MHRTYLEGEKAYCLKETEQFYACDPHDYNRKEQLRQIVLSKRQEFLNIWLREHKGDNNG
jgi:hypothetical protein